MPVRACLDRMNASSEFPLKEIFLSRSYRCFCVLCYVTAAIIAATMALTTDRLDTADASMRPSSGIAFFHADG